MWRGNVGDEHARGEENAGDERTNPDRTVTPMRPSTLVVVGLAPIARMTRRSSSRRLS
jgi:hypothetical protein